MATTKHRQFNLTAARYEECEEEYVGFCTACGAERDQCEPDAREYPCEECGENKVYGVPELLQMGRVAIIGDDDGDDDLD